MDLIATSDSNVYFKLDPQKFLKIKHIIETTGSNYIRLLLKDPELFYFVMQNTPLLTDEHSFKTRLYWIVAGLTDFPTCPCCGKKDEYLHKNVRNIKGYQKYCSVKCASNAKETREKKCATCRKHFNVDYPAQDKEIRDRQNATKLQKYGSLNNFQKSKETKFLRHGDPNWNNQEKNAATKLQRYGSATWNNPQKAKQTNAAKSEEQKQIEKCNAQQTFYVRYGKKCFLQSDEYKSRGCVEAARDAIEKKYGARNFFASTAYKEMLPEVQKKIERTHRANNSFSTSKQEEEAFNMLRFAFPHLQRQHKDKLYPFFADFYDDSLPNVRFEFQGTWTHGSHPFNPQSEEDLAQLSLMQQKGTRYYLAAIDTWTKSDPFKRETVKRNGIRLIEFWSLDEVREFVLSYLQQLA